MTSQPLFILPTDETLLRAGKLADGLAAARIDFALLQDNAMKFYLTGRVFAGWIAVNAAGRVHAFVRRPNNIGGDNVTAVRKPEEIPALLPAGFYSGAKPSVGFEFATLSVSDFNRLKSLFPEAEAKDATAAVRTARAVKTPLEIAEIRRSGRLQTEVYRNIPSLFHAGMTDIELQIEIERALRLKGCLGQFRIHGDSMELFMANIICGDNADSPTPYDFAMGGSGLHPSLPVGADGTELRPGTTVMVDANGNFTGYMTDMTRTFAIGEVPPQALLAHNVSIEICEAVRRAARPGAKASALYELAHGIAAEAGLVHMFMGHRQQAGFVGHGLGIEINEAPVLAPRSRDVIEAGNVFAVEPKFVIPGVGAVGIENTYVVDEDETRCLTLAPEQLTRL